ncbi:MAG: glycosyltransferase family 4 protein [Pontiella sp.]
MPKLKKITHVMRRFSPDTWGGTESVVFNLSRELIDQQIESPVFCTDMLSLPGFQTLDTVPVRRFSYVFPWLGLSKEAKKKLALKGGSPLSLPLFFSLLKEKNVSVIHTHVQHRLGGMARTVARLKRIPYVVSLHGGHFTLPQEQVEKMTEPFRGKLEWGKVCGALFGARSVLDDAAAIICVGNSEYEAVKQHYPEKHVCYMPNGVDVKRFSQSDGSAFRQAYGFGHSEKIILCVSRIDDQKNQLGLIRAFSVFSKTHPDHRLVLIGAVTVEAYRADLADEVQRLDLAQKIMIIDGFRPDNPLLPSAYNAAEMFVLASMHEPFGIVVLEAWASGIPVVANRIGGIPGFASDGENILLVEPGNEEELAIRMGELSDDVALRSDLSRRAFGEVATYYDWKKVILQLRQVYEQVINEA